MDAKHRLTEAAKQIKKHCDTTKGVSQYFEPGTHGYKDGIRHWLPSSSAVSYGVVQPGKIKDLVAIVEILRIFRVPFGIKGGGHFTSPKISSTPGIHIHMGRFDNVTYHKDSTFVDIGAGCLWDRVYLALKPYRRSVVGGSASEGVGVAGWLLGGGYSLKTNGRGIGIDHIVAFELVSPMGQIVKVTDHETDKGKKELFDALKGGGNNFGIITKFTLRTHEERTLYKKELRFAKSEFPKVQKALESYATSLFDKKSNVVAAFRRELVKGKVKDSVDVLCFYDGAVSKGKNPFQGFLAIKRIVDSRRDANYLETDSTDSDHYDSFYDMDRDSLGHLRRPAGIVEGAEPLPAHRHDMTGLPTSESNTAGLGEISYAGRFQCIMINKYTKKLIDTVATAPQKYVSEAEMVKYGGELVLFDIWPFLPTIFENSTPCAWPHFPSRPSFPLLALFQWKDTKENTKFWLNKIKDSFERIRKVAVAEKCTDASLPVYMNTSLDTTKVKDIYRENLKWLGHVRRKWDPHDVMGLASGFRIPLSGENEMPPKDADDIWFN